MHVSSMLSACMSTACSVALEVLVCLSWGMLAPAAAQVPDDCTQLVFCWAADPIHLCQGVLNHESILNLLIIYSA